MANFAILTTNAANLDASGNLITSESSVSGTLQSAAGATGVGTPLAVAGNASAVFTISGTFVGSVTFQGTEDGTNWSNISVTQLGTATIGTTATGPGLFQASVAGLTSVRANITSWTSGAITVTAHAVSGPFNHRNVNSVAQSTGSVSGTLQSAAAATGTGTLFPVLGNATAITTVSGTFVGTVVFEGTEDGTTWANLYATQLGVNSINPVVFAPGVYQVATAGLQSIRANITSYTSGAITVTAHAVPLSWTARTVYTNVTSGPAVSFVSPPAATTAATDTAFTFSQTVRRMRIQNKTSATVYYQQDGVATVGSPSIAAGASEWIQGPPCAVLHLYTVLAQNVNGTADANIVVQGWA